MTKQQIIAAFKGGLTSEEIGAAQGVTGQRIRQILGAAGLTYRNGGRHKRTISKSAARQAARVHKREERCLRTYGCDWNTFRILTGSDRLGRGSALVKAYWERRRNANKFRIEWRLSLPDYAVIIGDRMSEIGRGQLTLARRDKSGPYAQDNVLLMSQSENAKVTNGFGKGRDLQRQRADVKRRRAMALSAQGLSYPEIAKRMGIAVSTVVAYHYQSKNEDSK